MMKKFFIALTLALLFIGCKKNESPIPNVPVDFYIYLSEPSYSALNVPGNYVYVTGGYKGIIIYRESNELFIAFDRACSYDPYVSAAVVTVDSSGLGITDHNCGSKFNILDGTATGAPATRPLKRYNADYD